MNKREIKSVSKSKKKINKNKLMTAVILILIIAIVTPVMFVNLKGNSNNGVNLSEIPAGYSVSSCNVLATKVGEDILENGGNAVDAAVAMSYVLSVVEPYASGLGGGGCMIVYDAKDDDYQFYNYGAEAPNSGQSKTILVPGLVSGMETVYKDYGSIDFAELLEPAITYCDGFEIDATLGKQIQNLKNLLGENSVFYRDGIYLDAGDVLIQSELKETLKAIADGGSEVFYKGEIAEKIASNTSLKMSDLSAYKTIKDNVVMADVGDYSIATAPAPYSGVTLVQLLKMAELMNLPSPEEDRDVFLERLEKITVAAYNDRQSKVYDYRFGSSSFNWEEYVSDVYIADLMSLDLDVYDWDEESVDTTSFTVIDKNGMMVVATNTLTSFFGSQSHVAGFYLNSTGHNFGTGANGYEAGKRPRSYISPTIIKNETGVYGLATPGGAAIVKVLANVILDIEKYGTEPQVAVDKRRILLQGDSVIKYETGLEDPLFVDILTSGYSAIGSSNHMLFGNIAMAGYDVNGGYFAVTDQRRGGLGTAKNN
jgi:gamma-glutamyltranspeptidase/glutathione hydrolase